MAIVIYTYSNPYKINHEQYWQLIKNSFHLCVSQTLVNGLCDQYPDFYVGKLTTINNFVNILFDNWESDATAICQRAVVDNLIDNFDFSTIVNDIQMDDIVNSLRRNRSYVLSSLRIMFELGMVPNNIKKEALTYEQKCIVALFEELINTKNKHFVLKDDFEKTEIDDAIGSTIRQAFEDNKNRKKQDAELNIDSINKDIIVVHGIHQYTPIMLKTIECLSKYKTVVVLFNYQPDYKNVYQTWLDVYSWFESKVSLPTQNFFNDSQDYEGGKIADNLAAIVSGSTSSVDFSHRIEVVEFDNQTEFVGYVAKKFEMAELKRKADQYNHPALYYMEEQIYSANSHVNDILRVYFPEQFGERNFLDYPLGHFFISITNLWDPESGEMHISDLTDIFECLSSGIIDEENPGELISTLDKCRLYLANEVSLTGIIKKLGKLKKRINRLEDSEIRNELLRLEYYDVTLSEIDKLISGLNALNEIAEQFFLDFSEKNNNFSAFYKKISDVLVTKVLDKADLDEDFSDIVRRLLARLEDVKDIEARASFDCLRETMQLYLVQNPGASKGANWIARNFEQIDGDSLRRNIKGNEKTYHFACLSDQDMSITHRDEFPWPLDISFFEVAQAPVDWKYQVYVTSRQEYKNFRRYALIYGLAFSKSSIKLSYIKNVNETENDLYYLLRILNADIVPYEDVKTELYKQNSEFEDFELAEYAQFNQYDLIRFRLCKFRFLLESIIENKTVYKDEFLIKHYMVVVLENMVRREYAGKNYIRQVVYAFLLEQMEELQKDFPFINHLDITDAVNSAIGYIEKNVVVRNSIPPIQSKDIDHMLKREQFLTASMGRDASDEERSIFNTSNQDEVDSTIGGTNIKDEKYYKYLNRLCDKCANKEICIESFKMKKDR